MDEAAAKRRRYPALDETVPWQDRAQELECIMVLPETPDVRTFCFQTAGRNWFRYLPGQFITLELPVDGKPLHRTYTLSSSPSRPLSIAVTAKCQPGSVATRWMFEHLKVGDRIRAVGPAGTFSFHHHPADRYLFVSAGSGITPMMSMTKYLYDDARHTDITFVNCARRPSDLIFRAELERMATRVPDIKLTWIVEEPDPYSCWTGYLGRLNQLMLELICPDYFEREIFCCGPEPFMQGVRDVLQVAGFDFRHYHEESFTAPLVTSAPVSVPEDGVPAEGATARVVFKRSGVEVVCRQTDTLLEIARASGLGLPSACQFGVCGTCKIKKYAGEVHMLHNGGISDDDVAAGYVLACCAKPLGRVEIDA